VNELEKSRRKRADAFAGALERASVAFEREMALSRYTTIGLGGPAEFLVRPRSADEIHTLLKLATAYELPVKVLGAGSNLIVSDAGVRGVVLHTAALDSIRFEEGGIVHAGAGCHFPGLVRQSVSRGLRGLEAGVGIPGSLGGVLTMNAGAYQFSIGPLIDEVVAVSVDRGKVVMPRGAIDFRYRASSFGRGLIVAQARLVLRPDEPAAIRADMDERMRFRKQTQPVGVKSAGCIFKNPEGESAGKLLDDLGLKGFSVGGARISEVHANFIVHDGGASTADVVGLIDAVRERVLEKAEIELEPEVMTWS
jgi:UDP-N-acetylmuramate dehydrogenase